MAIKCNNLPTLTYKIDRLLDDPRRLAEMKARSRAMARPRAAFEVVETLRRMAGAPSPA